MIYYIKYSCTIREIEMDFKLTYLQIHWHTCTYSAYWLQSSKHKIGASTQEMYLLHASFHISGSLAQALKPLQTCQPRKYRE